MVEFHINAAQRSRCARAAYYCGVIKDIYKNEKDEGYVFALDEILRPF